MQPSLRETFGRVLIEAMASRKPVIATRVGGMPEIVVDGESGLLVPSEDPPALAAAIMSCYKTRPVAGRWGRAGGAASRSISSSPRRTRRLEAIYDAGCYANERVGVTRGTLALRHKRVILQEVGILAG